ncbi:MAG: hypothetical protein EBV03_07215 [Proteobacteria bacterium]|nr:hypothetical protein [Pseudomonadota bacterium]
MGILSDLNAKLTNARKAEKKIIGDIADKAQALPEYMEYEKAVVAMETRSNQYMSASHPASQVNPMDHARAMEELADKVRSGASKLHGRLMNDGVAEEHMHDVMNVLNEKAHKAAEKGGRKY